MTATPRPPARQPWPLWPIAVAIVVALAGYTYLRLAYAKPGKPHEPFAEHRRNAGMEQLATHGWTHAEAEFEAIAELPPPLAPINTTQTAPAAVEELRGLATENWHLPIEYSALSAPAQAAPGSACAVHFQAELDQARVHIVGFDLFRRYAEIVALPRWEPFPAELTARRPRNSGRFTIPPSLLGPGRYRITLPALKQSSQWLLEVAPAAAP